MSALWPWIAVVALGLAAIVALIVLSRKYGGAKAVGKIDRENIEGRERFDSAVEDYNASGGLAGAAGRGVRDASD